MLEFAERQINYSELIQRIDHKKRKQIILIVNPKI